MNHILQMDPNKIPSVLLVGNGVLRLGKCISWNDLLQKIASPTDKTMHLKYVPMAMQPECLCGVDVDEVQRRIAQEITESEPDQSDYLKRLVSLPFDAILTTNYTYEIEQTLTGNKWDNQTRKKSFFALDGNTHVRNNTCICNIVNTKEGRTVPVFHIHGEKFRKHSMILSYYSYANAVSRLILFNKQRGNIYQEKQQANEKLSCLSWLDFFLLGNVYSVGFGFDTSEFDIWWAIERKAREIAQKGILYAYMIEEKECEIRQEALFHAMKVYVKKIIAKNGYLDAYEQVLINIKHENGW